MAIAIAGGNQPPAAAVSLELRCESWDEPHLRAAHTRRKRTPLGELRTSQRSTLSKALKSLAQGRVCEPER